MPVRIQPVCDAKHIFSHVEWHMKGYVVFLQALGFSKNQEDVEPLEENVKKNRESDWIFVNVEDTKHAYAMPSAFVKYTEYLNMTIGKDAIDKK